MTNDLYIQTTINGESVWVDAFQRWGINISDGAISTLLAPNAMKPFVENKSRLQHGKRIIFNNPKYEEREFALTFHILTKEWVRQEEGQDVVVTRRQDFFGKLNLFCEEVLSKGKFALYSKYIPRQVFRLEYQSCSLFGQVDQEMAVFTVKVSEPNPMDRGNIPQDIYDQGPDYVIPDDKGVIMGVSEEQVRAMINAQNANDAKIADINALT